MSYQKFFGGFEQKFAGRSEVARVPLVSATEIFEVYRQCIHIVCNLYLYLLDFECQQFTRKEEENTMKETDDIKETGTDLVNAITDMTSDLKVLFHKIDNADNNEEWLKAVWRYGSQS